MQGLDYALSKTEQLSSANQLEHVQLSAIVNGEAVNVVAAPDAAQFLLNISASGKSFHYAAGCASRRGVPGRLRSRRPGDASGARRDAETIATCG